MLYCTGNIYSLYMNANHFLFEGCDLQYLFQFGRSVHVVCFKAQGHLGQMATAFQLKGKSMFSSKMLSIPFHRTNCLKTVLRHRLRSYTLATVAAHYKRHNKTAIIKGITISLSAALLDPAVPHAKLPVTKVAVVSNSTVSILPNDDST